MKVSFRLCLRIFIGLVYLEAHLCKSHEGVLNVCVYPNTMCRAGWLYMARAGEMKPLHLSIKGLLADYYGKVSLATTSLTQYATPECLLLFSPSTILACIYKQIL